MMCAREVNMFVVARAVTYSALFVGFLLVYVPARLLAWSGIVRPAAVGVAQAAGMIAAAAGAGVAVWCVYTFASAGRGTPAPFDPPRRLVDRGPYRFVRNPMYLGAGLALAGAALFYESLPILVYTGLFLFAAHLLVVWYEEPALRETFGRDYEAYRGRVGRWRPQHPRTHARTTE
jgi:protein-S-isoprenylcysteine O-methyltransferase Ste14